MFGIGRLVGCVFLAADKSFVSPLGNLQLCLHNAVSAKIFLLWQSFKYFSNYRKCRGFWSLHVRFVLSFSLYLIWEENYRFKLIKETSNDVSLDIYFEFIFMYIILQIYKCIIIMIINVNIIIKLGFFSLDSLLSTLYCYYLWFFYLYYKRLKDTNFSTSAE